MQRLVDKYPAGFVGNLTPVTSGTTHWPGIGEDAAGPQIQATVNPILPLAVE